MESNKALRSDGTRWFVRRSLGSPAFLERLAHHIEMGLLTHDHTMGDVQVYRVSPEAPFYRDSTRTVGEVQSLIDDAVSLAADESWDDLYGCLCELAAACKTGDVDRNTYAKLVETIEDRAATKLQDPTLPGRMRMAMGARGKRTPSIILLQ